MQLELTAVVGNIAQPRCTMSLTKVPFLAASTIGAYVVLTPPQPKASTTVRPKNVTSYERFFSSIVRFYTGSFKVCLCFAWYAEKN